jgi:hypothetical protein
MRDSPPVSDARTPEGRFYPKLNLMGNAQPLRYLALGEKEF